MTWNDLLKNYKAKHLSQIKCGGLKRDSICSAFKELTKNNIWDRIWDEKKIKKEQIFPFILQKRPFNPQIQ